MSISNYKICIVLLAPHNKTDHKLLVENNKLCQLLKECKKLCKEMILSGGTYFNDIPVSDLYFKINNAVRKK